MFNIASKPFFISLNVAKNNEMIAVSGRYIRVYDASSENAQLTIKLQSDIASAEFVLENQAYIKVDQQFDRILISCAAQPGEWIKLFVADGPNVFDYFRAARNAISSIAAPVMTTGGTLLFQSAVSVGVAATLIQAANSKTTGWAVKNNGSDIVYLGGDNTVSSANGYPLEPGESLLWDARQNLYGISATAGQDVRVMRAAIT